LKGKSSGLLRNFKALFTQSLPGLAPSLDNFISIVDLLEALGHDYEIDLMSGKGFEYYTGLSFQFFINEEKIGGGGRYDALIPLMSGKDVPASGFALYFDHLMNLVKPAILSTSPAQRISIDVESGAIKRGFDIAGCLRQDGYIAEFKLEAQEAVGLEWKLDVRSKPPLFVLTNQIKHKKFDAQTTRLSTKNSMLKLLMRFWRY